MCNKSKNDKSNREQICRIILCDDDGKIFFLNFDVTAILKDIEKMNFTIEYKNVINLSKEFESDCDYPEYAMKTDIAKPLIFAKVGEDELLIDGNHRLYKARKLNIENIPCYVITEEYYKQFLMAE